MTAEDRAALTEAELSAFAQKVNAWAQSLAPKERAFLEQMLADAADAANDDISGYANLSSLVSDDLGGYASISGGADSLIGLVVGYASGVARAEAEYSAETFSFDDH